MANPTLTWAPTLAQVTFALRNIFIGFGSGMIVQVSAIIMTRYLPPFPRLWALLGYMFPRQFRERVYTPSVAEDTIDYFEARKKFRTCGARLWLQCCFVLRTEIRLLQCFWVLGLNRCGRMLRPIVERLIRNAFHVSN